MKYQTYHQIYWSEKRRKRDLDLVFEMDPNLSQISSIQVQIQIRIINIVNKKKKNLTNTAAHQAHYI